MAKKKIPDIVKKVRMKEVPKVDFTFEKVISHSQITIYNNCPFRWKLQYKDKLKPFNQTIHTIFGTAIHEAIQKYLDTVYKVSKSKADTLDLGEIFRDKFKDEYKEGYKKNNNTHFSDPEEMREFCNDGLQILEYFQKKFSSYFGIRGWHFIGYEVPINMAPIPSYKNLKYYGFLDLVFYNEISETFKIVDIKTSTSGWGKETKKDFNKISQLLLYKEFFSKQFDVPIDKVDIEFFIVKRKLWEESDYVQKRIQTFSPPSGKTSINKAKRMVDQFIEEAFNPDNTIREKEYPKKPLDKNCNWCPFNKDLKICDKSIF